MAVSYATVIYPTLGAGTGKSLKAVSDLPGEFMKAFNNYLDHEKNLEKQGILLPGLNKAKDMIAKAKKDAGSNELAVKGGVDGTGNLIVSVTGILPVKGKGEKYEKFQIVRPGLKKLLADMKSETNVVVNLTKETSTSKGDKTINPNSQKQATRFGTTAKPIDEADFGGIKAGTVVLCAHGGAAAVSGTVIGTALGKKSAQEIVALLTQNPDKSKRLSKDFKGLIHLSGCYTAAGSGAIPEGYDYSTFAGQVLSLLKSAGYKNAAVRGHPGPAKTNSDGSKKARNAMLTPKGIIAMQQKLDSIYKAYEELGNKHGNDPAKVLQDSRFKQLTDQWKIYKQQQDEVIAMDTKAKQRVHDIEGLVGNFNMQGR